MFRQCFSCFTAVFTQKWELAVLAVPNQQILKESWGLSSKTNIFIKKKKKRGEGREEKKKDRFIQISAHPLRLLTGQQMAKSHQGEFWGILRTASLPAPGCRGTRSGSALRTLPSPLLVSEHCVFPHSPQSSSQQQPSPRYPHSRRRFKHSKPIHPVQQRTIRDLWHEVH